jgi:type I restriction enzyme R subunit
MVRDLINQNKVNPEPLYCVRVTANDGAKGEEYLRDFQDNEKTIPTILTTSQKLSTGVDARNVRNIVLMRPINSMIEFKQIIGRGTRLYDGKDYFTIHDFVKAYLHFSDPEWDGEPLEPEPPAPPRPRQPCKVCGQDECRCDRPPADPPEPRPVKITVKLADGKVRQLQSMVATTFWGGDGTPMSAAQFLESLFGTLPEFFKDEDELRELWSDPETRRKLLRGLADKGFGRDALSEMQKAIDAENSDLFDVLAYVAYTRAPIPRSERAEFAKATIKATRIDYKQRAFLDFVLGHYVDEGVDELDLDKLPPLLRLKYNAIADAANDLGPPERIREMFVSFQKHLYADRH